MGTATNEFIKTIHTTGNGSSHYGTCDQCGKPCAEHYVHQSRRVFVRNDGTRYLGNVSGGAYGHRDCLLHFFGEAIEKSTLQRKGNVLLAPAA